MFGPYLSKVSVFFCSSTAEYKLVHVSRIDVIPNTNNEWEKYCNVPLVIPVLLDVMHATWLSPYEGNLLFKGKTSEADSARF